MADCSHTEQETGMDYPGEMKDKMDRAAQERWLEAHAAQKASPSEVRENRFDELLRNILPKQDGIGGA